MNAKIGMREFFHHESCMGTVFRFGGHTPFDPAKTESLVMQACAILHEADKTFSLYKPESPLSRLARGEVAIEDLVPVVTDVWNACAMCEKITSGWFSAFTPEKTFDPSGLVKTWAAKAAADFLVDAGLSDLTINAGGDVWISGDASGENDWRVGLHKPVSIADAEAGVAARVDLRATPYRAVATSGSAERGNHIWNPKAPDRAAATELVQISVIGRDLVMADVWATAAFAMGPSAIEFINKFNLDNPGQSMQALAISKEGEMLATDGFSRLLAK